MCNAVLCSCMHFTCMVGQFLDKIKNIFSISGRYYCNSIFTPFVLFFPAFPLFSFALSASFLSLSLCFFLSFFLNPEFDLYHAFFLVLAKHQFANLALQPFIGFGSFGHSIENLCIFIFISPFFYQLQLLTVCFHLFLPISFV